MSPRRLAWGARAVLFAGVCACVFWLARLDHRARISTDVLELMPPDERDPELALVRSLAAERQGRVALFVMESDGNAGTAETTVQPEALAAFSAALKGSGAFRDVLNLNDPSFREALGKFVFERRFDLLLPGWLAQKQREFNEHGGDEAWSAWLAERVAEDLDTFLARPEALAFEQLAPSDPLLLVPHLAETMQGIGGLDAASGSGDAVLIWAEAAAPPLQEEGQGPVFAAVDEGLARARAIQPGVEVKWTAVSRFAAESRRRIEAEFKGLNLFALGAVVLVLLVALRRAWQVVHLVPVMVCSLLAAWTVTTLVFERAHMLVFVIGSLLGGIAVDYGLHVFLHRGRPYDEYTDRIRELWRPLLGSAATTLIGFALLATSSLPLLRQTGVFVCTGVIAAALTALLWFAQVKAHEGQTRFDSVDAAPGMTGAGRGPILGILAAAAVVAAVGPWRLHWHDDIRELEIRAPELWDNDRAVRARFGDDQDAALMLTRGQTVAQARAALDRLREWLAREAPGARMASVGLALPTEADYEAVADRVQQLATFETDLRAALERHGYDSAVFEPFFAAWRGLRTRSGWLDYDSLVRDFVDALRGPMAMAMHAGAGGSWFAVLIEDVPDLSPPEESATMRASQLETLNHLFARYRQSALWLSVIGLGLVAMSVIGIYGMRRGIRMASVPLGSVLFVFGLFGLTGQTLNLFHLLGAFLAVGMTIDYAIFAGESIGRGHGLPLSVRLSAVTTVASFGVLGFSAIPVVSALGVTVASIIASGWGLVELLARLERT